jgi:hypothetical protein
VTVFNKLVGKTNNVCVEALFSKPEFNLDLSFKLAVKQCTIYSVYTGINFNVFGLLGLEISFSEKTIHSGFNFNLYVFGAMVSVEIENMGKYFRSGK